MIFRLVAKSVTFNDLERRNGPYFGLFHRICVHMQKLDKACKKNFATENHQTISFEKPAGVTSVKQN